MADARIGPWRVPRWEVLNDKVYHAAGEILYVLIKGSNRIRYIGQSSTRLRTRWRTPPLATPVDGDFNAHLFHNRAWPHIERAFLTQPDAGPFTVAVLPLAQLEEIVKQDGRLRHLVAPSTKAGPRDCLSLRVEQLLCKQPALANGLWNSRKGGALDAPARGLAKSSELRGASSRPVEATG